jgi:hypothetical protein
MSETWEFKSVKQQCDIVAAKEEWGVSKYKTIAIYRLNTSNYDSVNDNWVRMNDTNLSLRDVKRFYPETVYWIGYDTTSGTDETYDDGLTINEELISDLEENDGWFAKSVADISMNVHNALVYWGMSYRTNVQIYEPTQVTKDNDGNFDVSSNPIEVNSTYNYFKPQIEPTKAYWIYVDPSYNIKKSQYLSGNLEIGETYLVKDNEEYKITNDANSSDSYNEGIILNAGRLTIDVSGAFINYMLIKNEGTLTVNGTLHNNGIIK